MAESVRRRRNSKGVPALAQLHDELAAAGVDVLLDDRDLRGGPKFKDADLIGIPLRVAIGKRSLDEGMLEVKWRRDGEATKIPVEGAARAIADMLDAERARLADA